MRKTILASSSTSSAISLRQQVRAYLFGLILLASTWQLHAASAITASKGNFASDVIAAPSINYQGRLIDPATGNPKPNGAYSVLFRLYNAPVGGSVLWNEPKTITVTKGLFSTMLGDVTPFNQAIFNGQSLWLGMTVGADPEMTPRMALGTVPYTFYANTAANATTAALATNAQKLGGLAPNAFAPAAHAHFGQTWSGDALIGLSVLNTVTNSTTSALRAVVDSQSVFATGVIGQVSSSAAGSSSAGVRGINNSTTGSGIGVWGSQSGSGWGVYGYAPDGIGVYGNSATGPGVQGYSNNSNGVYGYSNLDVGVHAVSNNQTGMYASSSASNWPAVLGINGNYRGVEGQSTDGIGVYGYSGNANSYAGYFLGNLRTTGTLSKAAGSFQIDHPLDPQNKYLFHSFVESPDMKNIYDGVISTGADGSATVQLPAYFEALNRDFRYQLTVIGQFAQAIVAEEVHNNQFVIRTDKPNVKVSWQVTGIRHDAYAVAHPIVPEQDKPAGERGTYLHPNEIRQLDALKAGAGTSAGANAPQAKPDAAAPPAFLGPSVMTNTLPMTAPNQTLSAEQPQQP